MSKDKDIGDFFILKDFYSTFRAWKIKAAHKEYMKIQSTKKQLIEKRAQTQVKHQNWKEFTKHKHTGQHYQKSSQRRTEKLDLNISPEEL